GGLITAAHIEKLKSYWRLRVRISMDGGTRETHDALRGSGTFQTTRSKISELASAGLTVGIGMTVSERNLYEIPSVVEMALRDGVTFLRFSPVVRVKRGRDAHVEASLHEAMLSTIIEQTIKHMDRVDLPPSRPGNAAH